ncbi:MAG TPA: hypothetical protein VD907_06290 [Verrucomicrobiae bacterium]|nr:hypothetical protein [Verrucomicrobiae bacterium]
MKVVVEGRDPGYEFDCTSCRSKLIAEPQDIRVGYFGANYGGDQPERSYYTECVVCGQTRRISASRLSKAARDQADARENKPE